VGKRRAFHVSYRLKLAELRYGRVTHTFFAGCIRRFATDELPIILADIYAEIGPAPNLLGIEILTIYKAPALPAYAGSN
jgi:uncharacterized Fe-S cluster-containing radical SAM superfamily protein